MKRHQCRVIGNSLMCLGLLTMVAGVASSVVNQLPSVNMPPLLASGAMFGIFIGALLWLAGARVSGREKIEDRYYWHRHHGDARCRRNHTPH